MSLNASNEPVNEPVNHPSIGPDVTGDKKPGIAESETGSSADGHKRPFSDSTTETQPPEANEEGANKKIKLETPESIAKSDDASEQKKTGEKSGHHHHKPIPHHHHHYDPNNKQGPVPHIHSGNHIHLVHDHGSTKEPKENGDNKDQNEQTERNEKEQKEEREEQIEEQKKDEEHHKEAGNGTQSIENQKESEKAEKEPETEPESKDTGKKTDENENEKDQQDTQKEPETNEVGVETNTPSQVASQPVSTKAQIDDVIQSVFPQRRHLGSLVYNPTTTWLTLQTSQLTGLKDEHFEKFEELRESYREKIKESFYADSIKYIPMIPPLPVDYINYLLEIKIPYRFVKQFKTQLANGSIAKKRELWGGADGIYTDDSDILSVVAHLGFFNNTIDLTPWNESWTPQDIIYPRINEDNDIKGDLSVTILLLPALHNYQSNYRNGLNSRNWTHTNRHDGLSYTVYNLKWEIDGSYLRDKSFFKRYQTEIAYDTKYFRPGVDMSKKTPQI